MTGFALLSVTGTSGLPSRETSGDDSGWASAARRIVDALGGRAITRLGQGDLDRDGVLHDGALQFVSGRADVNSLALY